MSIATTDQIVSLRESLEGLYATASLLRSLGLDDLSSGLLSQAESVSFALAKLENKPAQSGRCDCYNGHHSHSGRCTNRQITDPTRYRGEVAICEHCREHCPAGCGSRKAVGP